MQVEQVAVVGNREPRIPVRAGEAMHASGASAAVPGVPGATWRGEPRRERLLVRIALPGVEQHGGATCRHVSAQHAAHDLLLGQTLVASIRPLQNEHGLLVGALLEEAAAQRIIRVGHHGLRVIRKPGGVVLDEVAHQPHEHAIARLDQRRAQRQRSRGMYQ